MKKIPVAVLGATGMVGQRFITLLKNHPWFEIKTVAASPQSAGKKYAEAVAGRWVMEASIPPKVASLVVKAVESDMDEIISEVPLAFCALEMEKEKILQIEDDYAKKGVVVVSNNSVNRWSSDVPMIMPEINPDHLNLIRTQQKRRGYKKGFIVVKPNCSIQSYVPLLTPLLKYNIKAVTITTLQAVSGAGKTMASWPQMQDNVIPYIEGEEEKSEKEPLRIWGKLEGGEIKLASKPKISAACIRVPVSDGHMASVSVSFEKNPTATEILSAWRGFDPLKNLNLPSSPRPFINIMKEKDRPQTALERNIGKGMAISVGRLRESDSGFSFIGLSHNTIRGAAGGAILIAELLVKKGLLSI